MNENRKPRTVLALALVALAIIVGVAMTLYIANYFKPLPVVKAAFSENNVTTATEFELVERRVIVEMLDRNAENNGNADYKKKYSAVLMLPLPYYPMSDYQRVEATLGAYDDELVVDYVETYFADQEIGVAGTSIHSKPPQPTSVRQ